MSVSVVMATYNGERYIQEQLQSILHQSLLPDEVIICDDASSDQTVQRVKAFIAEHHLENWCVVINEKNLGYQKNFSQLIAKATGDYIFLSDQDDIWNVHKLATMVKVMQNNPQIWALNAGVTLIDSSSKALPCRLKRKRHNCNFLRYSGKLSHLMFFSFSSIANYNITPGCAMCITKQTQKHFVELYPSGMPHDYYLNLIAAANNGCAFLNEVLVEYRQHENNLIGASVNIKNDKIKKGTRAEFLQSRLSLIRYVAEYFQVQKDKGLIAYYTLYERMLSFYQHPTLVKLLTLYRTAGYQNLYGFKAKLSDIARACRLYHFLKIIAGKHS